MRVLAIVAAVLLSSLLFMSTAFAVCVEDPANTFTCDTNEPNPDTDGIQQDSNNNNLTVNMLPGSAIKTTGESTTSIELGAGNNTIDLDQAAITSAYNCIEISGGTSIQANLISSTMKCGGPGNAADGLYLDSIGGTATAIVHHSLILAGDDAMRVGGTLGGVVEIVDSQILATDQCCYKLGLVTSNQDDQVTVENSLIAGYRNQPPATADAINLAGGNDSLILKTGAELIGDIDCREGNDTLTFEMEVPQSELASLQAELAGKGADDSITINGRLYTWKGCETLVDDLTGSNPADNRAEFKVTKVFADGNYDDEVNVTLSCNSGLLLDQTKALKNGESVTFILTSFDFGTTNCTITEDGSSGYTAEYDDGFATSDESCSFSIVDSGDANECTITNTPAPVDIVLNKDWVISNENLNGVSTNYQIGLICGGEIVGINPEGPDDGFKNEGGIGSAVWNSTSPGDTSYTASVIPTIYPYTGCTAVETVYDDSVEISNDCSESNPDPDLDTAASQMGRGSFFIAVNEGHECTFTNTVFFEGIPTLSQYGMAILALLMLGVGFVGFRRLV